MRVFPRLCGFFLLLSLSSLCAEQLPEMRPALLGTGPKSLINLIDTESLMKRGQTDALVMFSCGVGASGHCYTTITYRGTPNSTPLAEETVYKCDRAIFIPAVYQHKTRDALISGSIIFEVINGKPHLRIYLNQETGHLKQRDDFISPQAVFIYDAKYKLFQFPQKGRGFSGTVVVTLNVDATGKLNSSKLVFESPPGRGFGDEVMSKIGSNTFLPGYLHGKPVACSATLQLLTRPYGRTHWKTDQ
jgi:hypothetical protein